MRCEWVGAGGAAKVERDTKTLLQTRAVVAGARGFREVPRSRSYLPHPRPGPEET